MENKTSVRDLQRFLREIAQYDSSVLSVIPDGFFGELTENSVKSFQRAYNLPVTGIADMMTLEAIVNVHRGISESKKPPDGIFLMNIYNLPINPGDENGYVSALQTVINLLAEVNPAFSYVDISGVHDEKTINEIKNIQKIGGLAEDGIVDKATWNVISGIYKEISGN